MKKVYLPFALIAMICIVVSCQKDIAEIQEELQNCKIVTGMYYGGSGMLNDSATFTYLPDGKLSRVENEDEYVVYSYNGDKITGRMWYSKPNNEKVWMDSITYNGNNIAKIFSHDFGSLGLDSVYYHILMDYQNNRLSKITYYETGSPFANDSFVTMVYSNAIGNIEKLVFLDEFNQPYDSIQYRYDNKPNYFKAVHPHFILFEPFFQLHAGFEPHLPYFYSTNNVIGYTIYGSDDYEVSYDTDSLNQVSGIKMDGEDYMRYRYRCQ